jgi:hypothetical protein
MTLPGLLIHLGSMARDGLRLSDVALIRRHKPDPADSANRTLPSLCLDVNAIKTKMILVHVVIDATIRTTGNSLNVFH